MPEPVWFDDRGTPYSVSELSECAAESVRGLNHLVKPGVGALTYPSQASSLVADLAATSRRLQQVLSQLRNWLNEEQKAQRLRADASAKHPSSVIVTRAMDHLFEASACAGVAASALDDTHQEISHLAANIT